MHGLQAISEQETYSDFERQGQTDHQFPRSAPGALGRLTQHAACAMRCKLPETCKLNERGLSQFGRPPKQVDG